ncbi:PREDICTED: fucolectin-1-like [Nanorana parkeri]|uniref:fucolectin-1-like n=1 Tax=Nanorana parkeri TaxID=125878 RepID=UPI000854905B|nr:PREDICTED: fucolectin-1-like [Nanorana parkeri]
MDKLTNSSSLLVLVTIVTDTESDGEPTMSDFAAVQELKEVKENLPNGCWSDVLGGGEDLRRDRNVALQGRATQSSLFISQRFGYQSAAINAIDGNQDPAFSHGSCSHTHNYPSPWWRVDLLRPYKIEYITITNRGDCCSERLNGAEILVGNSLANNGNDNHRCGVVTSIPAGGTQHVLCRGLVGRYVNIILRGKKQYLQLCEVQVWTKNK